MSRPVPRLFLLLTLLCLDAAATPLMASAERDGDAFTLHASTELPVAPAAVFARLADYANWERLSPSIVQSRRLAPVRGVERVHSVTRSCVLIFCARVRQVQEVTAEEGRRLLAVTVPGSGDLRSGRVEWHLTPVGDGTRVEVNARVVPAFTVPPLIGAWAVKRALRQEAIGVFEALGRVE